MFDIYYQIVIMVTMSAMTISPLVAHNIKQKSKVERLEIELSNLKSDHCEHVKRSEVLEDLLRRLSESAGLSKYIIDELRDEIRDLKQKSNGNGVRRSPL